MRYSLLAQTTGGGESMAMSEGVGGGPGTVSVVVPSAPHREAGSVPVLPPAPWTKVVYYFLLGETRQSPGPAFTASQ